MITLLIILVIAGVALYIISLIPMDLTVRRIIYALAILFLLLYILGWAGLWHLPK